uniref:NADH-ubiquinone oxidoreductase chain 5 n=1 Tax=Phacomorphus fratyi TaxID=723369 RepID=A0A0S2M7Z5_9COLE|nr:NADH dehydrogenase subunit 5 [Phacomorphus fratyi]ALO70816.1 NADH deshydrogenase subunit 5 [Phacomorphus fratyi]
MSLKFLILDMIKIMEFQLLSINSTEIYMVVLLDWISLMFMSFVLFISSMVINYSEEYMLGDMYIKRFIYLVCMFVLSMVLLIISPNLISILLGWDGLGLVSYCLVIYYQNFKSYNAGMLTALSNRIGDVALLVAIAWMMNYGSWNYIFYLSIMKEDFFMQVVAFLVLLAAFTKSAQIPFSSWLPAAMAAPTPVSSLVHSSTLVTAGVYLLIRFYECLSSSVLLLGLFISSLTMFMAGLAANFEMDLKKIIALSTLSQLGLMISIIFMGGVNMAFFHLLMHALFKALLFMCAGVIIHNYMNNQDIRYMGGLVYKMPLTCVMFNISNLSLCGFPFLAGFYSKDLILEIMSLNILNIYIYMIFYLSTGLTMMYTIRLMYYTMIGGYMFMSVNMISDSSFKMLFSMMGLLVMVIFGGSVIMWLMFSLPYFICLPLFMKLMALLVTLLGGALGYEVSKFFVSYKLNSFYFYKISMFLSSMWNMPFFSTFGVNFYPIWLGRIIFKSMDQGWSEFLGAQGLYLGIKHMSKFSQVLFYNNLKICMILFVLYIYFLFYIIYSYSL